MLHIHDFLLFLLVFLNLVELMRNDLNVLTSLIEHLIKEVHFEVHMIISLVLLEHMSLHGLLIIKMSLA